MAWAHVFALDCLLFQCLLGLTDGGRNFQMLKRKVLQFQEVQAMKEFYLRRMMHRGEAAVDWNPPIESYFRQPLDHFNRQNNATYNQRYWINEEYWKRPQGPIFLYIGGESSLSKFSVQAGEHVELAQSYGALLVALEHRYYGSSINMDGLTNEGIRFLSSQQALADLASFHRFLSEKYSLTRNNTWICFGGSYPGSLSAWFRLKVVAESLSDPVVGGSPKCLDAVTESFRTVDQMLKAGNTSQLEKDFCSCEGLQGSEDYTEFISNLADIFMGTVQYNGETSDRDIRRVCDTMTRTSLGSSYRRLMAINQEYLQSMSQTCVQNSYQKTLEELRNTSLSLVGVGERQWIFQTCTEFGYYQTCEDESCPFSRLLTLRSELDLCLQLFGISAKSVKEAVLFTNEYYGADRPKASRVLFVNGDIDPWHALSVLHNQSHSELAIYINGTAHCANMGSSKPLDPPALKRAKEEIAYYVGEWLKAAKKND
uniref:Thymus-specific serine protease isoform X2 n=1 Tax=Geotrypetes seraphini TaxID=260995 RepID=A0A6P8S6J8_GEOSA|nr:thymus-specific serine protease isoform X2 [Geotrypetes seraphini]